MVVVVKTELEHWIGIQADVQRALLAAAVPLRIDELRRLPDREHTIRVWAHDAVEAIAHTGGHALKRRTPRHNGEPSTADAFNSLARALAALSMREGGVEYSGLIWCARHSPSGTPGSHVCTGCRASERGGDR